MDRCRFTGDAVDDDDYEDGDEVLVSFMLLLCLYDMFHQEEDDDGEVDEEDEEEDEEPIAAPPKGGKGGKKTNKGGFAAPAGRVSRPSFNCGCNHSFFLQQVVMLQELSSRNASRTKKKTTTKGYLYRGDYNAYSIVGRTASMVESDDD